jgi:hypothetical protein
VHDGRIGDPEAIVCGYVHDGVAALDGGAEGFWFEEVAGNGFCGEAGEVFEVAGGADEETEGGSTAGEFLGYVATYEAGGSCEEDFQTSAPVKTADLWTPFRSPEPRQNCRSLHFASLRSR